MLARHSGCCPVEVHEIIGAVPALMADHGLSSYDAVHAASAIESGVGAIVTLDVGFASVPERALCLYVDASRVTRCRQIRS